MEKTNISCIYCGHTYLEDITLNTTTCEKCGKSFEVAKGSKYYKSLQKIQKEENKIALGEAYKQVDLLIDECEFYLDKEQFIEAETTLNKALELTTTDRRIYVLFTYAKTKNFTDYQDKSHYEYLKKAIELSNNTEKEELRKIYSNFYKKSSMSEEELEDYNLQLSAVKKSKVENLLKDGIPKHFKNEKTIKLSKILLPIFIVLSIVAFSLFFVLDKDFIFYIAGVLFVITFLFVMTIISTKPKVNLFNAVLDFYDSFEKFDISAKNKIEILNQLEIIAVSFINGETEFRMSNNVSILVQILINCDNKDIDKFILSYKAFGQFV